jgi:hypothetical protein
VKLKETKKCLICFASKRNNKVRSEKTLFKGSVQRKLRWLKNGVNRSVGVSDWGAGHSFVVLFGFHLDFAIFPFLASTAKIIGEFWKNK